ncbi:MAG TPA: PspC domain-containing protein [Jatrophihabitans sp.]|nr:PspC domain-containing protein [Jatrophihabitans sp.]
MTTTDMPGPSTPPPAAPPDPSDRHLRRSREGRVAAGVAAGLGRYFGVDPVLFRVLFATAAFFGGAGIVAYVIAWVVIPEDDTERAAVDGWIATLRAHRVPAWVVAVAAGLLVWALAFSWWAPGPFLPVLAIVVLLVVAFGRRDWRDVPPAAPTAPPATAPPGPATTDAAATAPVDLTKRAPAADTSPTQPSWTGDARAWLDESRTAAAVRRRRATPVRIAVLVTLVTAILTLAAVDAVWGIPLPVYFWTALGIVVIGLLAGLALRRAPWSLALLLVPTVAGVVAFGGTSASLHDGMGARHWRPQTTAASSYRLGLGQAVLDLRDLPALTTARKTVITVGAGQVKVIAPKTLNVTVHANVHIGDIESDGHHLVAGNGPWAAWDQHRDITAPAGATGAPLTVVVRLADGQISVTHP